MYMYRTSKIRAIDEYDVYSAYTTMADLRDIYCTQSHTDYLSIWQWLANKIEDNAIEL